MPGQIPLNYSVTNTDYFERIRPLGGAWFLDSGKPESERGRFDILVAQPIFRLRASRGKTELLNGTTNEPWSVAKHSEVLANSYPSLICYLNELCESDISECKPLTLLKTLYQHISEETATSETVPFYSGFLGYFGYDLGRTLETLPSTAIDELNLPDMDVGYYQWAIIIDHETKSAALTCHDKYPEVELDTLVRHINTPLIKDKKNRFEITKPFTSNLAEEQYHQQLHRIDEYIHAGDCYQVNFAQRFKGECQGDPWMAYKALRTIAPTPFSAYSDTDNGAILSLSPERFIMCNEEGHVMTQPIKGTRPRDNNPERDSALAHELLTSEKDRAENVMIVDLLRNDLSKTCTPGSVKAPILFDVEHYKNVHHLVSTVTGQLHSNQTPVDLLEQCFPGGSITGAPKIRAMEIIDELEPHRRHIYCGSIGYICTSGRIDTSITIRTLLVEGNHIYSWAGGGIVADSISSAEYQETFDKIDNLLETLESYK